MTMDKAAYSFEELINMVLSRSPSPEDHYEVAAILESTGWSDTMVQETFGLRDVFELANEVYQACRSKVITAPIAIEEKLPFFQNLKEMMRSFLRGTLFALPMALSIFAMLTIRYSLWSYMYFSVEIATSIALGTILSFMVTGGFTQATARRGFLYLGQHEYRMARQMSFLFIRLGLIVSLLTGLIIFLLNVTFSIFTWKMMAICIVYYLFLCLVWLAVTILYMLQKEMHFTLLLAFGIGFVYLFHEFFRLNIIASQMIALTLVAAGSMGVAFWLFLQAEQRAESGISPLMPRMSIVVYTSIPYFIYGFLYFLFLFIDRINAWSANSLFMPYLVWFRGEYELGLDWALLTLIIPMGIVEMFVGGLWARMVANQKLYTAREVKSFNDLYLSTYRRQMASYAVMAILSGLLVYFGMLKLQELQLIDIDLFMNRTTFFVFGWAVLAYVITAAGLLNALFLFCLSRPEPVVRGIGLGCAANLLAGFLLSRWVDYSWAVFGLVAGAIVFLIFTTISVTGVFKTLDFNLYALG